VEENLSFTHDFVKIENKNKEVLEHQFVTTVFTLTGHKEDELSKQIAENITKITKKVTVVIVGLHIEKATSKEIECLIKNTQKAVDKLKRKLVKKEG
jgi:NAD-specific glutamate dehydrogenase